MQHPAPKKMAKPMKMLRRTFGSPLIVTAGVIAGVLAGVLAGATAGATVAGAHF